MGLCSRITVLSQGSTLISGTPGGGALEPGGARRLPGRRRRGASQLDASTCASATSRAATAPRARRRRGIDASGPGSVPAAPANAASAEPRSRALLTLHGVCAGYGGGDILKQVTLEVPRGGITCVVGPNGAGKSTLMTTISGLLRPRAGRDPLRGEVISGLAPKQILARGIAQIPQAHSLFPEMTVQENVEMGAFTVSRPGARAQAAGGRRRSCTRSSASAPTRRPAASPAASSDWSSSLAA